jgi:mono/diheme cytochrome c family protein
LALWLTACGGTNDGETEGAAGSGGTSAAGDAPTWHADVAPLVSQHCQGCHRADGIGPFALETYAQAKMWSFTFDEVLASGRMPPFLAQTTSECEPRFGYKEDLRLSEEQRQLIARWVDAGSPEGDAKTAADLPAPPELELTDAELDIKIPSPVTIEGAGDKFICFSLTPDFSALAATGPEAALLGERVLIDAAQVHPGNTAIVHHVLLFTDAEGESAALAGDKGYYDCFGGAQLSSPGLVMAWAPGATPVRAPEGVAMAIPSKGRLVMQVHYHPTGSPQTDDATSVQLRRYKAGIPEYIAALSLIGNARARNANGMGLQPGPGDAGEAEFRIPAGERAHTESMRFLLPAGKAPYRIWAVGSHMHYVGTDMRIGIARNAPGDEPAEECLLQTPSWDFNWQRGYLFDAPIAQAPSAKPGDVLELRCTYDNSMQNRFVAAALSEQGLSAPRDVTLGEETLDEMCLGIFGMAQKVSDLLQ